MEWVETTGRTIAEAKELALDQLGVDDAEAEFEVIEEPKSGLFGRLRRPARVRARVRPRAPRPKVERRRAPRGERRGRGRNGGGRDQRRGARSDTGAEASTGGAAATATTAASPSSDERTTTSADESGGSGDQGGSGDRARQRSRERPRSSGQRPRQPKRSSTTTAPTNEETKVSEPVSVQEQGQVVRGFLEGLVEAFDLDAAVELQGVDDETIEVTVDGDDLGVLIGPKGQTLQAIQEVARASVQRSATGPLEGRVRIDIGAYRQKRREALARFARQQADQVLDEGVERALEPMNAADRKVVHDTINEIPGVRTVSEGEDNRRRVVIVPD